MRSGAPVSRLEAHGGLGSVLYRCISAVVGAMVDTILCPIDQTHRVGHGRNGISR